ncbi:MAG TPA: sodium:alanine symporter family protein [Tissierellia bacterium]|jgi:AGCS family alanine or glycine:cation symporter|nr:sodium:alanine symporter family protein [Tissierellia bacterium]
MELFENLVNFVNSILWDYVLIIGLVGIGLYFTVRLGFIQVKRFGEAYKRVFGGIFSKEENKEGSMSSFQALATSIAAQIGTGNVAGVATAITSGGPGAVFWMWISAFFGMSTIFVEATLAQKYRETDSDGQLVGGPAYYIKNGLGSKGLASFFAIALIIALGFIGNMVQSNSIADAVSRAFNIPQLGVGIFIAVVAGLIFIGGMKRIASFAELVVPVMAAIYILGSIVVIIIFHNSIISVFKSIFVAAFSPKAIMGGAAGIGVQQAVRYGIARGLFSNEAGMGSTPNSHAVADVKHPVEQGLSAMIAVFIDTVLVCTATAVAILSTGSNTLGLVGVGVTQEAFKIAFGPIGEMFLAICLTFFAFTTLVGWYYFGENNIRFLFKDKKSIRIYQIIVLLFIVLGSYQKVDFVWNLADMFNGIMVIPNLLAIFILFKESKELLIDYDHQNNKGERLHYNYKYQ